MLLVPTLSYLTLRSAAVQTWLAGKAADYLSDELDARVSVGGVNISWFMNVVLEDISLMDKQDNLLLYAKRLVFDVNRISFTNRSLIINKLLFDQAAVGMVRYAGAEVYNFQFLVDYFDTGQVSDTFKLPPWDISLRAFEFRKSGLSFTDQNQAHLEYGFDPASFAFGDLNIFIEDIVFERDTLQATVAHFSVEESKGLRLENLTADLFISPTESSARNLIIETSQSNLEMDLVLSYTDFQSFSDFFHQIEILVDFKPSDLRLYELGYFIPAVYGLDHRVSLKGTLSGKLDNLRGVGMNISYGLWSNFQGNFHLVGLPDFEETFLNFSVIRFHTTLLDLESFRLPLKHGAGFLKLPEELQQLGLINFSGNFTGFFYDFVAFGNFQTAMGNVSTDLAIVSNDNFTNIKYKGNIATSGFDLGGLLNNESGLGKVAFQAGVVGTGHNIATLEMDMKGVVRTLDFRDYEYNNIEIEGHFSNKKFNGNLLVDDPNLFVDFSGLVDFSSKIPALNFSAQIDNANLSKLNIYQRDSLFYSLVSTIITVRGQGSSFDNMQGGIEAFKTLYREESIEDRSLGHAYETDKISLTSDLQTDGHKLMRLESDFLDVQIESDINPDQFDDALFTIMAHFVPAGFPVLPTHNTLQGKRLDFQFHFKETQPLSEIFASSVSLSDNAEVSGYIDLEDNTVKLEGSMESLSVGSSRFADLRLHLTTLDNNIEVNTNASRLFFSDSVWVDQVVMSGSIHNDSLLMDTKWENLGLGRQNQGYFKVSGQVLKPKSAAFSIDPTSYAVINDSIWSLGHHNRIFIDSAYVSIENLLVFKKEEYLRVDGVLSNNPDDVMKVNLNNFNINSLDFLLQDRKIDFAGIASGELILSNLKTTPHIAANLFLQQFAFNNDHLGDLSLNSVWDAGQKAFKVEAEILYHGNIGTNRPLWARGYFYPERENDNFDIDIGIENLRMSVFGRYLESFASNFRGVASGNLRLEGPLTAPELSGRARLVRTGFRVDYLNTSYSFAHEVEIGKDYFSFDNLILNDTIGNTAMVSGIVTHNNFFNFGVDITLQPERIVVLNTQARHNELFYGRAFASGYFRVHGPANNIVMDISARANRDTQIFLPLNYTGELTESHFINFVSPDKEAPVVLLKKQSDFMGFTMNFDLELTPEAEVQIIFDSQIGDIMRGRGFGNLKFEIDRQGGFSIYGDYTVQEGDYLFTLQNLINKRFRMEQGGTIRWTGDPYDADIDIRALYRLRTTLFDLAANQSDTSDLYRRRVPVETVLHLQDKLFNPSISFDIQLPGGDESSREMIDRIITTDQEMNRQVFSLLVLNRFVPPEDGLNTALSYGMGSTSSELLSNQLSNWLSQISSDFDIGINYRPGDEISSQELEVALSTQLFDDRVVIDGNVGVAGNHSASTQRASNIIGDVNVEVKITPEGKFRVKAFNRSNTFDVLNTNAPYTQGVGVFYRKEFDNLGELFRRKKRPILEIPQLEELDLPETEARSEP